MKLTTKQIQIIIVLVAAAILVTVGIVIGVGKREKTEEVITEVPEVATEDAAPEVATSEPEPEPEPTLTNIAEQYLPNGQELEHQVLKGNFGLWQNAILFFYKEKDCFQCRWSGKVLIPQNGTYKQLNLPDFNQFDNETVDNIKIASVMFTNLDRDAQNEIIILNEGYRKGPSGYSLFNTAVLDWQYAKFGEMYKWEAYFDENCENAECLKEYIGAYQNFFGDFKVENEYIVGDLNITLTETGQLAGSWDAGYGEGHMCIVDFYIDIVESDWVRFYVGADDKGNIAFLENGNLEITFDTDMSELDCGYGHPDVLELQKK